jgi:hypothetical protein
VLQGDVRVEEAVLPQPWVAVEDMARQSDVFNAATCRWMEALRLPAHNVGRFWMFTILEVDDGVRAGVAAGAVQQHWDAP